MSAPGEESARHINVIEWLRDHSWLKLPLLAVREVGPAAQTLAGLLKITNKETYVAASRIAKCSCLPLATTRKHLVTLSAGGWVTNRGRQKTRRGAPRRTCTIAVTEKSRAAATAEYVALPWWGAPPRLLPWGARVLLAVITSRLMGFIAALESQGPSVTDWDDLEMLGGDERFAFKLNDLQRITGLSRHTVIDAKRALADAGVIRWVAQRRPDGGHDSDLLVPHEWFGLKVWPEPDREGVTNWRWAPRAFQPPTPRCKSGQ